MNDVDKILDVLDEYVKATAQYETLSLKLDLLRQLKLNTVHFLWRSDTYDGESMCTIDRSLEEEVERTLERRYDVGKTVERASMALRDRINLLVG